MQVRKFEASSMKEALAMVKKELGPEAIILSAKDNQQGFGLVNGASVEVTAAISEKMLKKKQLAEKKLRDKDLQMFQSSPAVNQKKFIEKVYKKTVDEAKVQQRSYTTRKYIDIDDDSTKAETPLVATTLNTQARNTPAPMTPPKRTVNVDGINMNVAAEAPVNTNSEVRLLKEEISRLKSVIANFQKVPQNFISVHPGAEKGVSFEFSSIFEKLRDVGVDEDTTIQLIDEAKKGLSPEEQKKKPLVDAWMAQQILQSTKISETAMEGFVHVFVGPSGAGKTSSLVKLAGQMVVNHGKKIALVTADTFKVGAADQLRIFAQILNVPFAVVKGKNDWRHILKELKDYDHILVDFPNMSMSEIEDIDRIRQLLPPEGISSKTHLVLSSTSKNRDLEEAERKFRVFKLEDVIFTRLDETRYHGVIYNFQRRFGLPLHSFGIGSKIPEDFEMATKERVLDLLFKLTKMQNSQRGA